MDLIDVDENDFAENKSLTNKSLITCFGVKKLT